MRILEYVGLDTSRVAASYRKVVAAIAREDFRAAQVKKLVNLAHGSFYRARLDDSNRLLFTLLRHDDQFCALMLEVIFNHDYAKSRFLRGAVVDEARIPDMDPVEAHQLAKPLRYLHPQRATIHLLDKPLSFDETQEAVYTQPAPLIIVGSAGSGKTALTLEKLKQMPGEVLYVTHSAFLAQSARDIYYANGFEQSDQDALFLSYREFVETIRVPPGREANWRDFAAWFARMRQGFKGLDAHQAFEEIRGVITAQAGGILSREAYLDLGVRQSIFGGALRERAYDLFDKYRVWLGEAGLFDVSLVAQDWLALAQPRYDFVVIDEVQDITPVQLALVLRTLKTPGNFLLCGDSNQIVHPNFFSWSQVKGLFWKDPAIADRQELRVLAANFRNGSEATRVANQLLKIKQRRFGSIDRESNYLVDAVGGDIGSVNLMPDKDAIKRDLDRQIRQSADFAVLVMRDEDKVQARKYFSTPLLFSIHEAKGLEYENIVLYRFVSDHRGEFSEIVAGVDRGDLGGARLDYRRARDKDDKSLEIYKFFVNALYVALTRATRNLYLLESDLGHPLYALLELVEARQVKVEARQSTMQDWQREARKLELQGKQEQAEAIRRQILKQTPVPWPVFDQVRTEELLVKVFRDQAPGAKHRQQLYGIAACQDLPLLAELLVQEGGFDAARGFQAQQVNLARRSYTTYFAQGFKDILRQCERHGMEHRLPMNMTPLMAAAAAGNVPLVEALIERGADRDATDHFGQNALHWAMREAFREARFAMGPFSALYDLLAPAAMDLNTGERLVRVDRHLSEYFLLQTMCTLFRSRFTYRQRQPYAAFEAQSILDAWRHLPAQVLRPERNQRRHLSAVLSRNEVDRDYAYNRALFRRVAKGWYQLNPLLSIRRRQEGAEEWRPLYSALNLALIAEFAWEEVWQRIDQYLLLAGQPDRPVQLASERRLARREAESAQRLREAAARVESMAQLRAQSGAVQGSDQSPPRAPAVLRRQPEEPKWGTREAKLREIERLRMQIEARRKAEEG